jgi:4-amino-4-deoxy-L-arabinose transferase-like glycosyltransferase
LENPKGQPWSSPPPEWLHRLPSLVLLALIHRTIIVLCTTTVASDAADYLRMAEMLSRGELQHALEFSYHPLFPMLTGMLGIPLGNFERAAYLVAVLSSSLAVIPLFHLVRAWWSERIARWTCILYALHPTLSLEGSEALTTGLFISLLISGIALIVFALRDANWALYPLGGIVAGLCYLTRPEGIYLVFFGVVGVAGALLRLLRTQGRVDPGSFRSGLFRLAGGTVVASFLWIMVAAPYLFWIHGFTGTWAISSRGAARDVWKIVTRPARALSGTAQAAVAPAPAPDPAVAKVDRSPADTHAPTSVVAPSQMPVISHRGSNRWVVLAKHLKSSFYWPLLPLWVIGVACCRREGGRWTSLLPLLGIALTCFAPPLISCLFGTHPRISHRYLLPGIPFLLPWAAAGFLAAWGWTARIASTSCKAGRFLFWAPQVVLVAAMLVKSLGFRRADEWTYIEAGAWLRQQSLPAPRQVLDSSEKTAFYGKCMIPLGFPLPWEGPRWIHIGNHWRLCPPMETAGSVSNSVRWTFEAVRKHELEFVILDEHRLRRFPPEFRKELELVGFERVAAFEKGSRSEGIGVWIYRLPAPRR